MINSTIDTRMAYAIQCHKNGEIHRASQIYQEILSNTPNNPDALHYSGLAAMQFGQFDKAICLIKQAIAIRPDISGFHSNLAMAYKENNQFKMALSHYQHAISLKPDNPVLYFNLGALCQHTGQLENARTAYMESLKIKSDQPLVYHNLGNLLLKQGDVQGAIMSSSIARKLSPDDPAIQSNYLFSLNYSTEHSPQATLDEHLNWGAQYGNNGLLDVEFKSSKRIHVGYVSPDFRNHSVAHFMQAILAHHDSQKFHIFCYSNVKKLDHMTKRLQNLCSSWRDIFDLNDDDVVRQIKADGIHILVDLAGHSSNNRLMVFAKKPAPIQITYLGYPNTSGLTQISYRFVDQYSDPDLKQYSGSEKRLYLPQGFLCYYPPDKAPSISTNPPLKTVTFGSFNNLPKVNLKVIELWANILKAVPESRLFLKTKGFNDIIIRDKYMEFFQQKGINKSRIQLMGNVSNEIEHLAMYKEIDIALDTFPYNGTTTTCEALWMGVPVITLAGKYHAARVGVSLLTQLGRQDWIAKDCADYIRKAIYLANHPEERSIIRQNLRSWLTKSDLCQGKSFVRSLESAYQFLANI
ncbi:O-linked N-acetylglucosamine transferase, SPINDLY family [Candidatus Magnetomorum sp. HK-1]|nr:O-linked N-acetylglucosamine transferase, SPINDLY family [Candidatus Magnetomorum sp. HK-1]